MDIQVAKSLLAVNVSGATQAESTRIVLTFRVRVCEVPRHFGARDRRSSQTERKRSDSGICRIDGLDRVTIGCAVIANGPTNGDRFLSCGKASANDFNFSEQQDAFLKKSNFHLSVDQGSCQRTFPDTGDRLQTGRRQRKSREKGARSVGAGRHTERHK